jgi:uncharacterized lipoprotein YajG
MSKERGLKAPLLPWTAASCWIDTFDSQGSKSIAIRGIPTYYFLPKIFGEIDMKRIAGLMVILSTIIIGGCTFTPKEIDLNATPTISDNKVGNGMPLYFRFMDDRDDMVVGVRGANNMGSKITAQNLPQYVEKSLREGLAQKGYQIIGNKEAAAAEIIYRLRSFKFSINMGFWTGAENKSAIIAVEATKGGRDYAKVYKYDDEDRDVVVPGGDEINTEMNEALAGVLNDALNDAALDNFLTGP